MNAAGAGLLLCAGALAGLAGWLLSAPTVAALLRSRLDRARVLWAARGRAGEARDLLVPFVAAVRRRLGRPKAASGRRLGAEERSRCLDELPELVDVVALGLSAGISFDAALDIYCTRYRTMLAGLLGDAMRSWRLGIAPRREALHALAERMGVGAFTTFVDTVTESLEFGAPLSRALAEQAESARRARRFAVEEQIEKAPVKMLVPTGTLVLPAMLLAILGPLIASLAALSA